MQPLAENDPYLRTCLMECIFANPGPVSSVCHDFWNCYRSLKFCFSNVQNPLGLNVVCFYMLASTWASHHSRVRFLNNTTANSAPKLMCFRCFHFDMCFVPQLRALVQQLRCQNCSGPEMLLTVWLLLCFAPQPQTVFEQHNFQQCSEPDMFLTSWLLRTWVVFSILTSTRASGHSHRRSSEPTFRLRSDRTLEKTLFSDFFFPTDLCLLPFSLFWLFLLWLLLSSHHCCCICPQVGSLIAMVGAPYHVPYQMVFREIRSQKDYMTAWPIWHIFLFQE